MACVAAKPASSSNPVMPPSSPVTQIGTPFSDALSEFVKGFGKKRRPSFVQDYLKGSVVNYHDVQITIEAMEKASSHKHARAIFEPIIQAMVDYTGVLDTLCQADPMPTAVIWGGLRAFIGCCARYVNLHKLIRTQLAALTNELARLKEYEDLFGHSMAMQELLKASYLNILRFYTKVESQCRSPGAFLALKSLTSFSTKGMDDVLAAIAEDRQNIARLVPIIQERVYQRNQKETTEEYRKAEIARNNILLIIRNQQDDRCLRAQERRDTRKKNVRQWIRGGASLNENNIRCQKRGERAFSSGSGAYPWLLQSDDFQNWLDEKLLSHGLWLRGGYGTGKSVICSYVVAHVKTTDPEAGVAFHYYRFDEEMTSTTVYRSIAEQLYDQLYQEEDDVSEAIHDLVTNKSDNRDSLKEMIKLLVSELSRTYISVDGLDEECNDKMRWEEASDVVSFFKGIAEDDGSTVRLWCSSQNHPCIRDMLNSFPKIQLDETTNRGSIDAFFANAMPLLDTIDITLDSKILVINELKENARGNFLWASLMVDTIRDATSQQDLQDQLKDALPGDVEKYYARKIDRVEEKHRSTVSKILSCIVYAKRPLLLEELCDAMAACHTTQGQNINKRAPLFKNKILELCAPLVEVQDRHESENEIRSVCLLSHAAVRSFLVKNPRILIQSTPQTEARESHLVITPVTLASICLNYLSQPCYGQLVERKDDKFETKDGEDIGKHFFLTYAAKYWSPHLDQMAPTDDWCNHLLKFVKSRQFLTLLQVQSLMVEGQFTMWTSTIAGPGFKRVFPRWFSKHHSCGDVLSHQYNEFLGEWGYFLDKYSASQGLFPGQINRCLWGTLGSESFLYESTKKFAQPKSFAFLNSKESEKPQYEQYFDCIHTSGDTLQVFRLQRCDDDKSQAQITCERWKMRGGHSAKLQQRQKIIVPASLTRLYEQPLRTKVVGRPPTISCTTDFKFARIGPRLYVSTESGDFTPIPSLNAGDTYFEEMASSGQLLAIATRRCLSEKDASNTTGLDDFKLEDFGKLFSDILEKVSRLAASGEDPSLLNFDEALVNGNGSSTKSSRSSKSSNSSSSNVSVVTEEALEEQLLKIEEDNNSEFSADSVQSLSARDSFSEGSTEPRSDEEEDFEQWNDWASEESLKDYESPASGELGIEVEEYDDDLHGFHESSYYYSDDTSADSSDGDSDEGDDTSSNGFGSSDGSESDNGHHNGAAELDAVLGGDNIGHKHLHDAPSNQRGKLLVYDISSGDSVPIFRYEQHCPRILFDSPPIFHPFASLVVWPLSGGEILFANFTEKTYYTRTLRCSASRSCHISIQGKFSICGEYLHLGALEIQEDARPHLAPVKPHIHLSFQLSTHRLSKRKTARSPPRLIFRTQVPLGSSENLSVSPLPYTLTWSTDHVYISKSQETLQVIRVPLFRHSKGEPSSEGRSNSKKAEEVESHVRANEIFLPSSAVSRKVHYLPPNSNAKAKDLATVVLGSRPHSLSSGMFKSKYETLHPLGVQLNEQTQLGGWKSVEKVKSEAGKTNTCLGGQLQGKYERFDRTDDCDIVPYLF